MEAGHPPATATTAERRDPETTGGSHQTEQNDQREQAVPPAASESRIDQDVYAGDKPPPEVGALPAVRPAVFASPDAISGERDSVLPGLLCMLAYLAFLVMATLVALYYLFSNERIQEEYRASTHSDHNSTTTASVPTYTWNQAEPSIVSDTTDLTLSTEELDGEEEPSSPVLRTVTEATVVNASVANSVTLTAGALP